MRQNRWSSTLRPSVIFALFVLPVALCSNGCEKAPEEAKGAKPQAPGPVNKIVRLTPEEIARGGIVVEPVARQEFRDYREFPGTVIPNQHAVAEVTALVRGRILEVYADLGQDVEAGTPLALLYSKDLGMAQSAYLKARARQYVAERAHERARSLLKGKVIGLAEAQRREGEMIRARAETRESYDRLLLLGMQEQEIQRLEREQKIRAHVPIVAPFAARVIARDVTKGEVVEVTDRLFAVADLSEVWVVAEVPEKDVALVPSEASPQAQGIEIRVAAYPDEIFHGIITYVGDVLDPTTRTVPLRLELPNPDRKLKPEMYARVRIYAEPEPNVLVVPEAAVQRDRERQFVFVQREPQTFEARDVRLGESDGHAVKVLDGLHEGESVVTGGAFVLKSELHGEQI